MNVYETARKLTAAEDTIRAAVAHHGDIDWKWYGTLANPNVVPLYWNDITVTSRDGKSRIVTAIDYVQEVKA
jgi:hypothetical protein